MKLFVVNKKLQNIKITKVSLFSKTKIVCTLQVESQYLHAGEYKRRGHGRKPRKNKALSNAHAHKKQTCISCPESRNFVTMSYIHYASPFFFFRLVFLKIFKGVVVLQASSEVNSI
jgi:hypothetical protein